MALVVKNLPANAGDIRGVGSIPGSDPLEEAWQPTPVVLPGEPHGQRSLVGDRPWGHKESDLTGQLNNNILPTGPVSAFVSPCGSPGRPFSLLFRYRSGLKTL